MVASGAAAVASVAVEPPVDGKMSLLTNDEKNTVSEAVARAESKTAGELVVVIGKRSGDYAVYRAGVAATVTVIVALELSRVFPQLQDWILLLLQLPLALSLYCLTGTGFLVRNLVPRSVQKQVVEQRALSVFLEAGVTETRDRSGVLIYLSEAEHRAVILGDTGIHSRVEASEWQTDVDALVTAIQKKRAAEGLLGVVARIGEILEKSFPARADDDNELADHVRHL